MSGDAGYTDQEAPILEKMIMDSLCEKTKSESWARDEITRLREENARLRSILATKVRPPFDDDLAGEPYATKDRQPEPGGLGRIGQVEGRRDDGGA